MAKLFKILVDPGHCEENRGSLYGNEGTNNFIYSKNYLKPELETYKNVQVDLTRNKVTDNPTLKQRGEMGLGYDLLISEHTNAVGGTNLYVRGTEVFDDVTKPNPRLTTAVSRAIASVFQHNNRGRKTRYFKNDDYYGVLRHNKARYGYLVEKGFHDNRQDCLFYYYNMKRIAKAEAKAIADHFGLEKKPVKIASTSYKPGIYRITVNRLNIRKEATKNSTKMGVIQDKGAYTITEVKNNWGRLKSGIGWIYLKGYTTKVK